MRTPSHTAKVLHGNWSPGDDLLFRIALRATPIVSWPAQLRNFTLTVTGYF